MAEKCTFSCQKRTRSGTLTVPGLEGVEEEDSSAADLFFEFSSTLESLVTFFSAPLGLLSPDGAAGSEAGIGCFSSVSFRVGPARGEGVMGVTGSSTRGSMSPAIRCKYTFFLLTIGSTKRKSMHQG